MKEKTTMKPVVRLRNVIMPPIWGFIAMPLMWIFLIPLNIGVDAIVMLIALEVLRVYQPGQVMKKAIVLTWIFGFVADAAGSLVLALVAYRKYMFALPEEMEGWWAQTFEKPMMAHPYESIPAMLVIAFAVLLSGFLIYLFNKKICLWGTGLDERQQRRVALALAIFTAPYLYFLG